MRIAGTLAVNAPLTPTPTIETNRLKLVGWRQQHFEAFAQLHADEATMQHVGTGRPLDVVESWLQFAMLLGHWQLRGYGVWAVEGADTDGLVGRAGLFHPAGWPDPELNWMISPAQRGRGYATEAAAAALEFAFSQLGLAEIVSLVRPANAGSHKVAAKLGGTWVETIDFMGAPMDVYRYRTRHTGAAPVWQS